MKFILDTIKKVLLENRVDDVKEKFPEVDPEIINYFVRHDPSGNNKYLEWMVKAITHKPTLQTIGEILNDNELGWGEPAGFIVNLIQKFHELLPYMKNVSTNDLYQYRFTDSEMINFLGNDLLKAKELKDNKEKDKKAKKNSDKIYEDSNWLVVRPKTWEASCVYGAGTKWCTTNKESDHHFKRETDRNFLIYVIDKNKSSSDVLYKVAWQLPYAKNMSKRYGTQFSDAIDVDLTSGVKLWNAEDTNIGNRHGREYMSMVSNKVKASIFNYMDSKMREMYQDIAYVDDPHMQALIEHLGISEDDLDNLDEERWKHYGMKTYDYDGTAYAVGTEEDVDRAKYDWARSYVDDVGYANAVSDIEDYIQISDPQAVADDMADSYIGDLRDEDFIDDVERAFKNSGHWSVDKLEEYKINQGIFESNQEEIDELESKDELTEEEEMDLDELQKENDGIETHNEKILNSLRDALREDYSNDYEDRLKRNPLDWLWEMGYYSKKTGEIEKSAFDHGLVEVDEDKMVDDIARDADLDTFGSYDEITVGGTNYYVFSRF